MRKLACIVTLFMFACTVALAQQPTPIEIHGTVKDENGKGVPGASVILKGSSLGTQTDADGNFKLVVPSAKNAQLEFGSVGFERQTVSLNGRLALSILLKKDTKALEDVVVIGYG